MRPSNSVRGPLCAAVLVLPALAACSGDPAPPSAASPAPSATVSPAPSTHAPPPLPGAAASTAPAEPPSKPSAPAQPSKPAAKPGTPGTCGTVTAASGLTLYVYDDKTVPCAQALPLVKKFQDTINGRQPPGSNSPVSATVDGWLCVSGPPAAQGGTTCGNGGRTVLAAVVPAE